MDEINVLVFPPVSTVGKTKIDSNLDTLHSLKMEMEAICPPWGLFIFQTNSSTSFEFYMCCLMTEE